MAVKVHAKPYIITHIPIPFDVVYHPDHKGPAGRLYVEYGVSSRELGTGNLEIERNRQE